MKTKDYGSDPLGNGKWRMAPSGDIVDKDERERRIGKPKPIEPIDGVFGLSWDEIEQKQGGKLTRDQ
tara:strand:- start:27 stop:227 length:201 start_codon:yes stop_codon:yes gene_type:complete